MRKGGPERMQEASRRLAEISHIIDKGEAGVGVSMPIEEAAFVLRIKAETLRMMGKRRQELGISVKDSNLNITLHGGEGKRREAYQYLYGLIQTSVPGMALNVLEAHPTPSSLLEEIPELKATIELIEKGTSDLSSEDLAFLHICLYGWWVSLKDKTDLFPPENVFV